MNILVVRNDKLGDFTLSLPCFARLKTALPEATISALVPSYTKAIADVFPFIDKVLVDEGSLWHLTKTLKKQHFDVVIVLFSSTRIALATLFAGIHKRIAPKTKLAQIFYRKPVYQKRSQSIKPEFLYNLDLVDYFLQTKNPPLQTFFWPLVAGKTQLAVKREQYSCLLMMHPGSGGSANNLILDQYIALANHLLKNKHFFLLVSAGKNEENIGQQLIKGVQSSRKLLLSGLDLLSLLDHINDCDVFISGSTGPAHLAGILNKKTVVFYPNTPTMGALRWQTLNSSDNRLAISPDKKQGDDLSQLDIKQVSHQVLTKFQLNARPNHQQ